MSLSPLTQEQAAQMETGIRLWKQMRGLVAEGWVGRDGCFRPEIRDLSEQIAAMPDVLMNTSLMYEELEYLESWIKEQMSLVTFSLEVVAGGVYTDPPSVPRLALIKTLTLNGKRYFVKANQEAWMVLALIYKCSALTWESEGWEDYSNLAFSLAKLQIHRKPWFRGVCTNSLQDCFNEGYSVTEAAEYVANETFGYDADWWNHLSEPNPTEKA